MKYERYLFKKSVFELPINNGIIIFFFYLYLPFKNVTLEVGTEKKRNKEIKICPYNKKKLRIENVNIFVWQFLSFLVYI